MSTFTNTMQPEKKVAPSARNSIFRTAAILTVIFVVATAAAIGIFLANRSTAAAENNVAVPYSNALELQYAQPWLEAQNKPVVTYSNALEMQYARPWLEAQNKSVVEYSNALEMQYARPWLDAQEKFPLNCSSSLEMFYACKYGYGLP